MKRTPQSIVDFHVHLFPDKGFDAIWNVFKSYGVEVVYRYYSGQCIDYLSRQGVGTIVFSNYAHKKGIAETMNQWNLALLDRHPNLYCFAAYHPDDDEGLQYAAQVLSHPRVIGIKLHCLVQRIYPHDERLMPLYEMVIARKKRLLLHVGTGPMGNEFVGVDHFRKVLRRFPHLPANVAHMGGLEFQAFIELLDDHPHLCLDTAYRGKGRSITCCSVTSPMSFASGSFMPRPWISCIKVAEPGNQRFVDQFDRTFSSFQSLSICLLQRSMDSSTSRRALGPGHTSVRSSSRLRSSWYLCQAHALLWSWFLC
ncbi:MAG: amidohydrolase family protein [Desulfobacterales bacterium]|nr:amidohydrolase family protein [Desulfobacterales bacterium]